MSHRPVLVAEIRDLGTDENDWQINEPTDRACMTCGCGVTTGFVDRAEANRIAEEHYEKDTVMSDFR